MKNIIIIAVGFLAALHMPQRASATIVSKLDISTGRNFADLTISNPGSSDYICAQVSVKLTLVADEFNEIRSDIGYTYSNLYVPAGQAVTRKEIGKAEIEAKRAKGAPLLIWSQQVDPDNCRPAGFADYCKFAPHSGSEAATLSAMKSAVGASCESLVREVGHRLSLERARISNLKPLSYLTELRELDLEENKITDLRPLRILRNLVYLDISHNPVRDLDSILNMPRLENIDASHTLVNGSRALRERKFPLSRSLEQVCVAETPLARRVHNLARPFSDCY